MHLMNKKMMNITRQSGVSLVISLIILLALTVIGLSAANRSNLQERMAANLHIENMAFSASESAISGFIGESFIGVNTSPAHVLYNIRNTGSLASACYDSTGARAACGLTFLDSDHGSAVKSEVEVTVISSCEPMACGGNSLGADSPNGCRLYKIDGKGSVAGKTVTTSLWAWEQTICIH